MANIRNMQNYTFISFHFSFVVFFIIHYASANVINPQYYVFKLKMNNVARKHRKQIINTFSHILNIYGALHLFFRSKFLFVTFAFSLKKFLQHFTFYRFASHEYFHLYLLFLLENVFRLS